MLELQARAHQHDICVENSVAQVRISHAATQQGDQAQAEARTALQLEAAEYRLRLDHEAREQIAATTQQSRVVRQEAETLVQNAARNEQQAFNELRRLRSEQGRYAVDPTTTQPTPTSEIELPSWGSELLRPTTAFAVREVAFCFKKPIGF